MERARTTWTDERIGDFTLRVGERLDRIDERARREREENERRRWEESEQRFHPRVQLIYWMGGVAVGMALATIVFLFAERA